MRPLTDAQRNADFVGKPEVKEIAEVGDLEYIATCPRHGRVLIEMERTDVESWGYHRKLGDRWCRFRVRSWLVRPGPDWTPAAVSPARAADA